MATINKALLREEFDTFKENFKQLKAAGEMTAGTEAMCQGLFMLLELILAVFLEKTTKKSSINSSIPSSQTEKDESALGKTGTHGKGKYQRDERAKNTRTRETASIAKVSVCETCGTDLTHAPCRHYERRTKIDIVFEKVVKHVDAEVKACPDCETTTVGSFPKDMPGPRQYGQGLKAYAIDLIVSQMVALKRVQHCVQALIGELISQASLLKWVIRLYEALEDWEASVVENLLKATTIHTDETSLQVSKRKQWIHVYSSGEITLKYLHVKRGKEAINDINIIPRYSGTVIHDCWASYLAYDQCNHGLCGSHLLRELTFIIESNGYRWAFNMKRLLKETCKKVSKGKRKKLTMVEYKNLQKRYRNIITRAEQELPPIPEKTRGKRGRVAKSDAHNLWERLKYYESSVLLFAKEADVSFTNNRAEQDLRMAKVKQKVSGCFRTELLAKAYCRISSYLQTMANKGYGPLMAIQIALAGKAESTLKG